MEGKLYLLNKGWRVISNKKPGKYFNIIYWDHPNHQPDRHGAFTTYDAIFHQRNSEKFGCDCIKTSKKGEIT